MLAVLLRERVAELLDPTCTQMRKYKQSSQQLLAVLLSAFAVYSFVTGLSTFCDYKETMTCAVPQLLVQVA